MGHGKKNTNRGEAIARNTIRVRDFGKRLGLTEKELSIHRKMIAHFREETNHRLDLLERPIHRKARDWIRATWERIRKWIRPPAPIEDPSEEETDPGIEIIPPGPTPIEAAGESIPEILDEQRKTLLEIVEENTEGTNDGNEETESN